MPEVTLLSYLFFAMAGFLTAFLVAQRWVVKKAHLILCVIYSKHGATFSELSGACPSLVWRKALITWLTEHRFIEEVLFFKLDSDTGVYQLTLKGKTYYLNRAVDTLGL